MQQLSQKNMKTFLTPHIYCKGAALKFLSVNDYDIKNGLVGTFNHNDSPLEPFDF